MDREKVIKEFEHLLNAAKGNYQDFVDLTVDGGEEILALLKEQETHKFFVDESGKITPLPIVFPNCPLKEYEAVVRCKDCRHYDETQRGTPRAEKRRYVCDDFNPPPDWFCADGEKRTD